MPANDYHFITTWRFDASIEEVAGILGDPLDLPRWWPSVYLGVQELKPEEDGTIGRVIDLYTKGWLPYTLRWQFTITDSNPPHGFTLTAEGDFVGRGIWTFVQEGQQAIVTYDWKLRAEKPLLRRLSLLMKPIFAANHRWAMARGEESLQLELERRHSATPAARAAVPPPPGPTRIAKLPVAAAGTVAALAGLLLWRRRGSGRAA